VLLGDQRDVPYLCVASGALERIEPEGSLHQLVAREVRGRSSSEPGSVLTLGPGATYLPVPCQGHGQAHHHARGDRLCRRLLERATHIPAHPAACRVGSMVELCRPQPQQTRSEARTERQQPRASLIDRSTRLRDRRAPCLARPGPSPDLYNFRIDWTLGSLPRQRLRSYGRLRNCARPGAGLVARSKGALAQSPIRLCQLEKVNIATHGALARAIRLSSS
jgi:hypothetical protein